MKAFVRELFKNTTEHSNTQESIFVSSFCDGNRLHFTIVDCKYGFQKQFSKTIPVLHNSSLEKFSF